MLPNWGSNGIHYYKHSSTSFLLVLNYILNFCQRLCTHLRLLLGIAFQKDYTSFNTNIKELFKLCWQDLEKFCYLSSHKIMFQIWFNLYLLHPCKHKYLLNAFIYIFPFILQLYLLSIWVCHYSRD